MAQIPHGHEHLNCPFWQKPMSEVCHKCPMWVQIRGKDPQSNAEIDEWHCSLGYALAKLLLESAQQSRQAGASDDKVATEIRRLHDTVVIQNEQLAIVRNSHTLLDAPRKG